MKVIAAAGLKVPTEQNPREYITEDAPVDIEVTAYYLRRLADNELVEVAVVQATPTDSGAVASKPAKTAS